VDQEREITMIWKQLLPLALLAACIGCNTAPPDTGAQDQADIRALENKWLAAVRARDLDAVMSVYVPDPKMVVFDVSTPMQYVGWDVYRKDWQAYLAEFEGPIDASIADLDITVGGNVAYSYSIQRIAGVDKDGTKIETTVRVTDGYKKINGHWLIAHEHVSVPIDMATKKGDMNAKVPE
jgi:ketosteroid isomerase-like protein